LRLKYTVLLPIALAVVALAAGCGGSSGSTSAGAAGSSGAGSAAGGPVTTSSITKAEFIKRANAICVRGRNRRLREMRQVVAKRPENAGGEYSRELIVDVVREVFAPTMERQVAEFRALGAPAGDAKEVEAIVAAYERAVAAARELRSEKDKGPVDEAIGEAGSLAEKYGFKECHVG
jgi:hypothetical protein